MNIVIFSPVLKATTGSPIRAFNIINGLSKYGDGKIHITLVSSTFDDELLRNYKCYPIEEYGIKKTLEIAVKESNADILFCITHGYANIVSKVAKIFEIPFFVDIHGIRTLEVLEEQTTLSVKVKNICESVPWFLGVMRANKIFCANPTLYVLLRKFFKNKSVDLCGITDVSTFKYINHVGDYIKILYAGNLRHYQGVDLLLDAINIIGDRKGFKFYILGNVGADDKIKQKLKALRNFKNLTVEPSIDYNKYPDFLSSMDVFVVPRPSSMTAYMAFPQKLIEAMSAGKCVIATNLTPHKIALTNPTCGILCEPNSHSLASAIIKTKNSNLRKDLGKAARIKALKNYDLPVQISKIIHSLNNPYK